MTAAIARRNGWTPGTLLVGDEGHGATVIRITAVGEEKLLAVVVSHDGKPPVHRRGGSWDLSFRDWRVAE